ncbi:tubulin-like doman-containing protein [Meiothermus ruber]|uniref:Tubulin-like protein n=1 Tax=Meiothermus ruber (strain ATCC 35948 / DSM 1279 / VKM B-1258 / 21) TaxID=504728 RepID=D3PRC2_MEIRD|nr:tubulin-like doman-containing protein [Meiothermus ruber]ADD28005.1 hypothetical protein Mrub_1243 [Meiothermus ruber DSM 1279]AGK04475.1 hypothetical protein K649_05875 [Meiothermus ruber DSM 1279]MCL6530336.1 hypothetical protein [Meiothermus ruber]GAO74948.1 putative uncharacterized protein [Meiothermus ruber H328]
METKKLKRTVLIGLGGTGKWALLHAKKKLLEAFGEEPPLVKFLLIDTTAANNDHLLTADGKKARLQASEILHIEARGASLLPKVHDEIREWFPPKADLKANILAGAGQIRALGRLALFANASLVYENLRDLLALARDYKDERPSGERRYIYEPYTPHLTVAVVGSLAGGTGSGTFLDVAFLLRQLMKDEDQLFGYFLLPDIYTNRPGTQNVEANAYGALKELDHFMNFKENLSYTLGGRRIQVEKKPFDMVFLVNRQNRAGKTFNEVDDLTELLGLGLFLQAGPMGKEQADVFDNIAHQLNEQKGRYYGKTAHYASFGAAELRFELEKVLGEARKQATARAIQELLAENPPWEPAGLRQAIEEALGQSSPEPEDLPRVRGASSPEDNAQVIAELEAALNLLKNRARETARRAWEEVRLDPWPHLEKAFLDYPLGSLVRGMERLREELNKSKDDLRARAEESEQNLQESLDSLKKRFGASQPKGFRQLWNPSPPVPLLTSARVSDTLNLAWDLGVDQARAELAQELLRQLEATLERIKTLRLRLSNHTQAAPSAASAPALNWDRAPFTLTLPPPYLAQEAQAVQEGRVELSSLRQKGLRALLENTEEVLQSLRLEEVGLSDWLRGALQNGDETLKESIKRAFRELDHLAAPAWDYQDAWVSNPNLGYREMVSILGVGEKDGTHDPLEVSEDILNILAGNIHERSKLQKVSTGDGRRVLLYRIEASIPAFALRGVEAYREKYQALSKDRSFHLHRSWEEGLEDLFPLPDPGEAARIWTRARLLGIIREDKGEYSYEDTREVGGRRIALGSTPGEAFEAFAQDFFAFKEVEGQVVKKDRALRRERERLQAYLSKVQEALESREGLLQSRDSWMEKDLAMFEREKAALQALQEELQSYNPDSGKDTFPSL